MGNAESRAAYTTSESIERLYAERNARNTQMNASHDEEENEPLLQEEPEMRLVNQGGLEETSNTEAGGEAINAALSDRRIYHHLRNIPASGNAIEAATVHLTIAVRAMASNARDAVNLAIAALKNIDARAVAKAGVAWIAANPLEFCAIVIPLLLLVCTPAILASVGFTAGGIAAGSIAAGIQASIGSVAAGSVFATLTSAAMGGFGVPIVLGSVWCISSAALWGVAAWRRWRRRKNGDRNGGTTSHDGTERLIERRITSRMNNT